MIKSYGSLPSVLITPLLLAVGCVNAPTIASSKKLLLDPRSAVTAAGKQAPSSMASAAVGSADQTADDKQAYYDEATGSQDLVAVDLETNGTDELTEVAVVVRL